MFRILQENPPAPRPINKEILGYVILGIIIILVIVLCVAWSRLGSHEKCCKCCDKYCETDPNAPSYM